MRRDLKTASETSGTAPRHKWQNPRNPSVSLRLWPLSGISGKLISDQAPLILCSELFEFVLITSGGKLRCERLQFFYSLKNWSVRDSRCFMVWEKGVRNSSFFMVWKIGV